jgi:hypothetical protein
MIKDIQKDVALLEELRIAVQTLDTALLNLLKIDLANDEYYPTFLLLSNGFERLLKATIVFYLIERDDDYPTSYPWMNNRKGHDIVWLIKYVVDNCFPANFNNPAIAKHESNYLTTNPTFTSAINIISEFGISLRYANLDRISGRSNITNPEQLWSEFETFLYGQIDPDLKRITDPNKSRDVFKELINRIHDSLKYGVAAIARLYTLGNLSSRVKQASPILSDYFRFGLEDTLDKISPISEEDVFSVTMHRIKTILADKVKDD